MSPRAHLAMTALLATMTVASPAMARDATHPPRAEIEQIVRDYILANPEIILEAIKALEKKEAEADRQKTAAALASNRARLLDPGASPTGGNPKGDVTLVEFFDYNCPYCKRAHAERKAALETDGKVRLVLKEFPILGPGSVLAAKAALAARKQDKYLELHEALMQSQGPLTRDGIMAVAKSVGIDTTRLGKEMDSPALQAEIDSNLELARTLGIRGTPAFIVGETLLPGAVDADALVATFKSEREKSASRRS